MSQRNIARTNTYMYDRSPMSGEQRTMSFQIRWSRRWAYKKFSGTVSADEFALSLRKTQDDPRFDELALVINDLLEVDATLVTGDDIRKFIALGVGSTFSNAELRTVVLTRDAELAALVTHYAAKSPLALHVFASVAELQAWLPEQYRGQITAVTVDATAKRLVVGTAGNASSH